MELKPCPFCGENLVRHEDHHGWWFAHQEEPGPCFNSHIQIFDEEDAKGWNTRIPWLPEDLVRTAEMCEARATRMMNGESAGIAPIVSCFREILNAVKEGE